MRILPFVGMALLGTTLPLAAQTLKLPVPAVQTAVSPIRTQEYEAVSHPDQVDRTTQAQDLRFKGDGYDRMTVPVRVSGGECVGADLRASVPGLDQGTITLTQNAADVTAVIRSETTGLTCRYDGNASFTGFAATAVSCDAEILFQCSTGQSRILRPIGSTFTATQNGATATGTVTTSYNIFSFDPVSKVETPVAGMTVESQFTAVRR